MNHNVKLFTHYTRNNIQETYKRQKLMPDESQCKVIYPFIVVGRRWNLEKQTRNQTGCPRDTKRRKTESSEAKRITKKETG